MRLAVLTCEDAQKWENMTLQLWRSALGRPGDDFSEYHCPRSEFPSPREAAERFDALLIGGSHYSAYEDLPWILALKGLIPRYVEAGARLVGCCFGCQILAAALGGHVGRNPSGRFVLGVESVSPTRELAALPAFAAAVEAALSRQQASDAGGGGSGAAGAGVGEAPGAAGPGGAAGGGGGAAGAAVACGAPCLRVMESHGDQVLALPPGALRLASSATAQTEMWALAPSVLAFQFHIEFGGQIALEKILPSLAAAGRLTREEAAASDAQLRSGAERPGTVAGLVRRFIEQGLGPAATGAHRGEDDVQGTGRREGEGSQPVEVAGEAAAALAGASGVGGAMLHDAAAAGKAVGSPLLPPPREQPDRSLPAGGTPAGSGPPTPTAATASERSSAAPASTVSAAPFASIARQRRDQQHAELIDVLTAGAVRDASAAFDARMRLVACDTELLAGCGAAAADEYGRAADVATALAAFAGGLGQRQADAEAALALVPEILSQLGELDAAVADLEAASKELERRAAALGPPPPPPPPVRPRTAAPAAAAHTAAAAVADVPSAQAAATAPSSSIAVVAASATAAAGAVSSGLSSLVGSLGDGGAAAYRLVVGGFSAAGGGGGAGAAPAAAAPTAPSGPDGRSG